MGGVLSEDSQNCVLAVLAIIAHRGKYFAIHSEQNFLASTADLRATVSVAHIYVCQWLKGLDGRQNDSQN